SIVMHAVVMFYYFIIVFFFFFSSRRRHTRCYRDWSSDVCSSDLFFILHGPGVRDLHPLGARRFGTIGDCLAQVILSDRSAIVMRSEERRVGKECRSGWVGGA